MNLEQLRTAYLQASRAQDELLPAVDSKIDAAAAAAFAAYERARDAKVIEIARYIRPIMKACQDRDMYPTPAEQKAVALEYAEEFMHTAEEFDGIHDDYVSFEIRAFDAIDGRTHTASI